MTPEALTILFDDVLACACSALDEMSVCGCPCRIFVAAGPPVWDNCCPDGQLTVHLERLYVAGNFPGSTGQSIVCSAPLAVDFNVTLLRCHPTVDDNGNPPLPQVLDNAANDIHTDLYIMVNALICCLARTAKRQPFTIRNASIIGPNGGCVAAQVQLSVQLSDPTI